MAQIWMFRHEWVVNPTNIIIKVINPKNHYNIIISHEIPNVQGFYILLPSHKYPPRHFSSVPGSHEAVLQQTTVAGHGAAIGKGPAGGPPTDGTHTDIREVLQEDVLHLGIGLQNPDKMNKGASFNNNNGWWWMLFFILETWMMMILEVPHLKDCGSHGNDQMDDQIDD